MKFKLCALIILSLIVSCAGTQGAPPANRSPLPEIAPDLETRLPELPRTVIDYDRTILNENETRAVMKLIEASRFIDEIF